MTQHEIRCDCGVGTATPARLHADRCVVRWAAARSTLKADLLQQLADRSARDAGTVVLQLQDVAAYLAATDSPPASPESVRAHARATTALRLIAADPFPGLHFGPPGECTRESHGLTADHPFPDHRWCPACIAWAGLTGNAPLPGLDPADPRPTTAPPDEE